MGFLLNRLQTTLHTIENVLNGSESSADSSINYVMGFQYHVLCIRPKMMMENCFQFCFV